MELKSNAAQRSTVTCPLIWHKTQVYALKTTWNYTLSKSTLWQARFFRVRCPFAWLRGTMIIDLIFQEIQGKPWAACARGLGLVSHFLVGAFEEKIPPYVLLGPAPFHHSCSRSFLVIKDRDQGLYTLSLQQDNIHMKTSTSASFPCFWHSFTSHR